MRKRNETLVRGSRETAYALQALQHVFARMPWGKTITFKDGRKAKLSPFVEPRWTPTRGGADLVDGAFEVEFEDGGHIEFWVTQAGYGSSRRTNQARAEWRDLVTGERVRPGTPGAIATGKYVMRIRPEKGAPFQVIEVDREDFHPAKDTFGVAKESYPKYRQIADREAKDLAKKLKQAPTFRAGAEVRIPGAQTTFRSPQEAVEQFLSHNPSLWGLGWADVGDQVDDFMDRVEAKRRGRYRAFDETARGRDILELFKTSRNDQGLQELLVYLFGRAKGRRWEDVPWDKVEELVDIFAESARREADRTGSTTFLAAGIPKIEWMPPATGFSEATPAFVESLAPKGREYFRRYRASQDLHALADTLDRALTRNRKCLSKTERAVVRKRIATIRKWAEKPDLMPEWACASFQEPAQICDLLGIQAEVNKLARACETEYAADWPLRGRDSEPWQPGLGVLPEAAAEMGEPESLDLPWETAANPRRRR